MDIEELIGNARDTITVRRVYGDPYEKDGVTIVPAAALRGGLGVGTRAGAKEHETGTGGGFGLVARPIGVYAIRDGRVTWRPAVDVHRMIGLLLGGFAIAGMLAIRLFARRRVIAFQRRSPRRTVRAFLAR
jgi:uncharacterized spore protein YtfJ